MVLNREQAPEFIKPEKFTIPKPDLIVTDGGIPIYYINAIDLDIVKLEFIFRNAGKIRENVNGVSVLTSKLLLSGTAGKSSKEINAFLERLGIFVDASPGIDYSSLSLFGMPQNILKAFPTILEILRESIFPELELETQKNIQIQQIKVNKNKNSYLASRLFKKVVFGESTTYGKSLEEEDIEAINRQGLVDFYDQNIKDNFEIIISGKVESSFVDYISKSISSLAFTSYTGSSEGFPILPVCRIKEAGPNQLQNSLRLGKRCIDRNDPDYTTFFVLNEVLGGYFGSRLMQNIREEKGYTYGIYSTINYFKDASFWYIGADVISEHYESTINEVQKEMQLLKDKLVGGAELSTVVNYIKGNYLNSINTSFSVAERFKGWYLYGLDEDYYNTFFDRLDSVSQEGIIDCANQFFDWDSMSIVSVGKE